MKSFTYLLAAMTLLAATDCTLLAQWVQTNGPYGGIVRSLAVSRTNLFAGTDGGVFLSTNNGTTWTAVNSGLTNTYVSSFAVSGTNLFAGTGGVWRRPLSEMITSVENSGSVLPSTFALLQNYPNPFNPSTKIGFKLQASGFTSLRVYNMLGEEVASLVNEALKPGRYEVTWEAEGLASGVYFYRLTSVRSPKRKSLS